MKSSEIRSRFLAFFEKRGHAIIPSAPIPVSTDPTTLFNSSGMQPLVPYLMGQSHPMGKCLTDSQKCLRVEDIEEVGDNRHTTFFEMLGNWSLGDYFKAEQLPWYWEFLTQEIGLDPQKLFVTAYIGNDELGVPKDIESIEIWKRLFAAVGIDAKVVELDTEENGYEVGGQDGRIFLYSKKNWWSRSGAPDKMPVGEIGGPCSEVFYDYETPHDTKWGPRCHVNCDCGRYVELGNSVFIQYLKNEKGGFDTLPQKNVDHGSGLSRIVAASQGIPDVFKTDVFSSIIYKLEDLSGKKFDTANTADDRAFRIISDHITGSIMMISDGVLPSSSEQGYVLRRLLRRAVRFMDVLGAGEGNLSQLVPIVADLYGTHYGDVKKQQEEIMKVVEEEEKKFRITLEKGLKKLMIMIDKTQSDVDASQLFDLYQTDGFPVELSFDILKENFKENRGIEMDPSAIETLSNGFNLKMEEHRKLSQLGAEQKFKGGLADSSIETTKLHTAHHLLLAALQQVLGSHVHQKGSNITAERLRIDFSHDAKMTDDQKVAVEKIVNDWIAADLPMVRHEMSRAEAIGLGAEMEFGAKYPDMVSVYVVGTDIEHAISKEFCGGPHMEHTGGLGTFKIQKEEASSNGVRRIKAVLV
jgi:alanyl-tRNA synthetase